MSRAETDEQKMEKEFHLRIRGMISKKHQGYVMGAFRSALDYYLDLKTKRQQEFKQPDWTHVGQAFIDGAREARLNPDADESIFKLGADAYTKQVFEKVDPHNEERIRLNKWDDVMKWKEVMNWKETKADGLDYQPVTDIPSFMEHFLKRRLLEFRLKSNEEWRVIRSDKDSKTFGLNFDLYDYRVTLGTVVEPEVDTKIRELEAKLEKDQIAMNAIAKGLETMKHSIGQAIAPGNDWRRELQLMNNCIDDMRLHHLTFSINLKKVLSYHDVIISAPGIESKKLFDLPFNFCIRCTRFAGWELWDHLTKEYPRLVGGGIRYREMVEDRDRRHYYC